jgi:hypothetical protein
MENLFSFSESARQLHIIVAKVTKCFVENHQIDAILDMPQMYNTLYKGYPVYMCVRGNGFDTIKRYAYANQYFAKRENKEVTNDEEFEMLRKDVISKLGAEAYIKVYPDVARIDVLIVRKFNEYDLKDIKYQLCGLEPMVEVNFVESFI